jgi:hypothetical protein
MTAYESSEDDSSEAVVAPGEQDHSRVAASDEARVRRPFPYEPDEPVTIKSEGGFAGCYVLRHEPENANNGKKETYVVLLYVDSAAGQVKCTIKDDGKALIVDVPEGFTFEQLKRTIWKHFNPRQVKSPHEPPVPNVEPRP